MRQSVDWTLRPRVGTHARRTALIRTEPSKQDCIGACRGRRGIRWSRPQQNNKPSSRPPSLLSFQVAIPISSLLLAPCSVICLLTPSLLPPLPSLAPSLHHIVHARLTSPGLSLHFGVPSVSVHGEAALCGGCAAVAARLPQFQSWLLQLRCSARYVSVYLWLLFDSCVCSCHWSKLLPFLLVNFWLLARFCFFKVEMHSDSKYELSHCRKGERPGGRCTPRRSIHQNYPPMPTLRIQLYQIHTYEVK